MSIFYTALNGSDAYPGTEAQPFRTINQGVSVLSPGNTLYVKGGTYTESLDTFPSGASWANPVILKAYPGDIVIIKPSSDIGLITLRNCSYVIFDEFAFDGDNRPIMAIRITPDAHHIRVQNSEIVRARSWGGIFIGQKSDFNELINLNVHDNGITDFNHGVYIEGSNNLVDRCFIHHNAGWGVHIYNGYENEFANDNIVRNSEVYENAKIGDRGAGILLSSGSGNLAYNNLVWGNNVGIQVAYGVSDAKALNNTIFGNDRFGMYLDDSIDAILRNNIIYQNNGPAISDRGSGTIQDHNLIDIDPRFVDVLAHDFHLRSTSPAINTGMALSEVQYDFDGVPRPQGTGYDIGAYEYKENIMSVITDLQVIEAGLRQQALDLTARADALAQSIVDLKAIDDALDTAADVIELD